METQLIAVNDLGYMRHNRAHANRYRHSNRSKRIDSVAREFQKLLMLLERDVIAWFGRLTTSKSERVLRYKSEQGVLKYQEIDFIAESRHGLKFCELKFKDKYSESLSQRASGLAQLATTTTVAKSSYELNGSLAICVDMTFLYKGEPSKGQGFSSLHELPLHLESVSTIGNSREHVRGHIWLDIKDILSVALSEGWMTVGRMNEFREVYETLNNPMARMPQPHQIPLNSPFSALPGILAS